MEKANPSSDMNSAIFIEVTPNGLKEIAARMEFAKENANNEEKIYFLLTKRIIFYCDPKSPKS